MKGTIAVLFIALSMCLMFAARFYPGDDDGIELSDGYGKTLTLETEDGDIFYLISPDDLPPAMVGLGDPLNNFSLTEDGKIRIRNEQ